MWERRRCSSGHRQWRGCTGGGVERGGQEHSSQSVGSRPWGRFSLGSAEDQTDLRTTQAGGTAKLTPSGAYLEATRARRSRAARVRMVAGVASNLHGRGEGQREQQRFGGVGGVAERLRLEQQ